MFDKSDHRPDDLTLKFFFIYKTHFRFPSFFAMYIARSTMRFEYPHSLSYHDTTFTNVGDSIIPAFLSKIDERASVVKSEETTSS